MDVGGPPSCSALSRPRTGRPWRPRPTTAIPRLKGDRPCTAADLAARLDFQEEARGALDVAQHMGFEDPLLRAADCWASPSWPVTGRR
ncbi:hypothetical protein RB628_31360 [Streptomyces sp. ADMS]|uniref:hypothetical protein n=1 Tax=Streptomyces sp. ADMS TaxID=3071415 RepID=UPI00296FB0B4|nr:hypothetical protein [Streptomyces sp. ADMS]MDW4909716.1 hypothetical protein [Streptomyces sp. ADMS]